jgi:hypothetical protein
MHADAKRLATSASLSEFGESKGQLIYAMPYGIILVVTALLIVRYVSCCLRSWNRGSPRSQRHPRSPSGRQVLAALSEIAKA